MNEPGPFANDAPRDPITGLPAIETVRGRLGEWLTQAAAGGEPARVHALLLGLRRFDAVNLAYGAHAGDAALAEVAGRICRFAEHELDGSWLVARGSGGNFLLAANEACSRERWHLFAEQLADLVAQPMSATHGTLRLSPKLALLRGLAGESVESMLDRLGHTLASGRHLQGRRIAWAEGEAVPPGRTTAQLEADLFAAIDRDEIEILFQPQFATADDRLTGAEALARWQHPALGRIGASALFAAAERAEQVAQLSRHIARCALAAAAPWPEGLRLSLNVTAADLAAASYAEHFMAIVRDSGFAPQRLTLEVTEQTLLSDVHSAARTLRQLSAQGLKVALDDFGAGFCNFRYLKLLPLDYLKLDRSMVDGIADDERDIAVLRAIVAMAGALGLEVIAEGVESEDQRARIAEEGCAFYQGFLRAQPMGAAEFLTLAGR
jgi:diguanylate cyclase